MNQSARRVNALAKHLGARRYLEIGVHAAATFRDIEIAERTGVDPGFVFDTNELSNELTRLVPSPSDSFFAVEPLFPPYDVVFIDGDHKFEQVVRDFSNTVLRTHRRSAVLIDDTLPNDVYSAMPNLQDVNRYRKAIGSTDSAWMGDVFKTVFYIHDFWPGLNYRTITGSGNAQTLVWRANGVQRTPLFNNLERISRLSFFDLQDHMEVLHTAAEEDAIALCVKELQAL
jgi:hypothetical protein